MRTSFALMAAAGFALTSLAASPARADWDGGPGWQHPHGGGDWHEHEEREHEWHEHHGWARAYPPPPVYYAPPPVVYLPPPTPVYVAPAVPVYAAPPVISLGVVIR